MKRLVAVFAMVFALGVVTLAQQSLGPWRTISSRMSGRRAPSAIRIPISRSRSPAIEDITP